MPAKGKKGLSECACSDLKPSTGMIPPFSRLPAMRTPTSSDPHHDPRKNPVPVKSLFRHDLSVSPRDMCNWDEALTGLRARLSFCSNSVQYFSPSRAWTIKQVGQSC